MIESLLTLLQASPVLSIVLLFALGVLILILFRTTIIEIVKKKYGLYNEAEIVKALDRASEERLFYSKTSEKLTPTIQERVLTLLKNPKQ